MPAERVVEELFGELLCRHDVAGNLLGMGVHSKRVGRREQFVMMTWCSAILRNERSGDYGELRDKQQAICDVLITEYCGLCSITSELRSAGCGWGGSAV